MNTRRLSLVVSLLLAGLVASSQCNTFTNLALGKPAVASSLENAGYPASNAFDGNGGTRWSSAFSDPQYIYVDLGASFSLCEVDLTWENAYATAYTIDISNDASAWTTVASISGNSSLQNNIALSGSGRYVRMSGISRATGYGYSLFEFKVFGAGTPVCNSTNLALNQPAVASSLENAGLAAANAVDGNMSTRWSSAFSDAQSLYVDLGSVHNLCQLSIQWENAYATAYTIDVSNDAATWTTVTSVSGNASTSNIIDVSGSGRYVRMSGISRATGYGYSIYELQVTDRVLLPLQWAYFRANAIGNRHALLQWATFSESNTSYFDIERSADGRSFTAIGRTNAAGNSATEKEYAFTDSTPLTGAGYYRIRQVDLDGKASYSNTQAVTIDATASATLSCYPNPVTDKIFIRSTGAQPLRQASLYNGAGTWLGTWRNPSAGNTLQLPAANLPPGLYLLRVTTDKNVETIKLIK